MNQKNIFSINRKALKRNGNIVKVLNQILTHSITYNLCTIINSQVKSCHKYFHIKNTFSQPTEKYCNVPPQYP